jgi:hypothetical protein
MITSNCAALENRSISIFLVMILMTGSIFLHAQQRHSIDANQVVRRMVDNELESGRKNQDRWMYRLQRLEGDKSTVKEIVETTNCQIDFLLSVNGETLTSNQRQQENNRLEKLVNDPEEQQKKKRAQEEDDRKAVEMFKMLPEAFSYRYSSSRGALIELAFTPNPSFRPPTREAQVFHAMEGTLLVDTRENRLVELDGRLAQDVEFLGGLFGHLEKGGHFIVKRGEIAPGQWAITHLTVEIKGKALIFKSINFQQIDSMSDFRPLPADVSPAEAADLLKKPATTEVAGELALDEGTIRSGH